MKTTYLFLILCLLFTTGNINSQTTLKTSFEAEEGYTLSPVANINNWNGDGEIIAESSYVHTGAQSLRLSCTASPLQTNHIAFTASETGLTEDIYFDMWINVKALNGQVTISTNDLFSGSSKRGLTIILTSGKQIKVYSGNSGTDEKAYTPDEWFRLSSRIDYMEGTYQVAINGEIIDKIYNFRDSYNPSSLGRESGLKEYHSLQFSNSKATNDIAIDDLYIGTNPIEDVPFPILNPPGAITINQPLNGTITLSPEKELYQPGESVTASVVADENYKFTGWTGSLSGNKNPNIFTVVRSMTIGASIEVDASNPPPTHTITLIQPRTGGEIRLQPEQDTYYKGTQVEIICMSDIGYELKNWTDDLSGDKNPHTFIIEKDMTIDVNLIEKETKNTVIEVNSVNNLKAALIEMEPGHEIIVEDGDYCLGSISLKSLGGNHSNPVIVRAKNIGKARLTDKTNFTLNACQNIIFQGFNFDLEHVSTIFKLEGSSYIRITQNEFRMKSKETQSSKWIIIGEVWKNEYCRSKYNRIDHNLFEGKYDTEPWVTVDGSHGSAPDISKYDRIDHNHFRYNQPRITNDKETIRIGVSSLSMLSSFCTIEHNLFEECDGDPEVISIKSCDNIIRNNTFLRSLGTLSLRHGFRNRVEGNYFFGDGKTNKNGNGCGGIRVYGLDHIIINNYFEGLTGSKWDAAITITNGDVVNTSSSLTSHFLPENVIVAFNTLVNNVSNIEIGFDNNGNYKRAPQNCLIANNIIIDNTNPIIKSYSDTSLAGVRFENNIMYPTGTSTIGISHTEKEIKVIDPKLIKTKGRTPEHLHYMIPYEIYKISTESEARNAAKGEYDYIVSDGEGQNRSGTFDIGADEYNTDDPILYGVLGADHVGIYGTLEKYETYDPTHITNICKGITKKEIIIYPNPFVDMLHIQTEKEIEKIEIISLQGEILVRTNSKNISLGQLRTGTYILSINYKDGQTGKTKIIKK